MIWFDLITIGILIVSLLIGLLRGLVKELFACLTWFIALFAANHLGRLVAPYLPSSIHDQGIRLIVGMISVLVIVLILMKLVATLCQELLKATGLVHADKSLGALFGVIRGLVIGTVLTIMVGLTDYPKNPNWHQSLTAPLFVKLVHFASPWLPGPIVNHLKF